MKTLRQMLQALITREGISPTYLSRVTGVSQPTISRILNGKIVSASDSQVMPLATFFGVTTDQLRGRDTSFIQSVFGEHQNPELQAVGLSFAPMAKADVLVPFLEEADPLVSSAGLVVNPLKTGRIARSKLEAHRVASGNARCLSIRGNSMQPVLRHGATVGIDLGSTSIIDGDLYAINHTGLISVRQVYRAPSGGIRLRSYNRDEYSDEELTAEQIQAKKVVVLGRVFWIEMFI